MGGVFALVAVGLTMIHGVMKVVNFAQGDFLVVGMFIAYVLYNLLPGQPLPYWLILPVAAGMYLFGCIIFQTTIKRVLGQGDSNYILLTIGISFMIQNLLQLIFGANFRSLPVSDQLRMGSWEFLSILFPRSRTIAFLAAIVFVFFVNWFLSRTDLGRAMRATADNRAVAESLGIKGGMVYTMAFAIGTMFAGLSGLLLSPVQLIFPAAGLPFGLVAMSAMVLGGLGNIKGAFIGGLIIGLVESFTASYVNIAMAPIMVNFVLILVLIFKPYGILGKKRRTS
jgi:branched-chain amino acid transport system permease protein